MSLMAFNWHFLSNYLQFRKHPFAIQNIWNKPYITNTNTLHFNKHQLFQIILKRSHSSNSKRLLFDFLLKRTTLTANLDKWGGNAHTVLGTIKVFANRNFSVSHHAHRMQSLVWPILLWIVFCNDPSKWSADLNKATQIVRYSLSLF